MTAPKKATAKIPTKAVKPKAPPAPKFGEVGYKFTIMAEIVDVGEPDNGNYAFSIKIPMGQWEDFNTENHCIVVDYNLKEDFINFAISQNPALAKQQKQEELAKAKALVAELTKQIAAMK